MKKRVLIISAYFAPQNAIGAVRPTKLAKYLTRMGYAVTVLCGADPGGVQDPLLARDLAELADVRPVPVRSLLGFLHRRRRARPANAQKPAAASPPSPAGPRWRRRLIDAVYLWLYDRADAAFARACVRTARGLNGHYDAVLSTYGPLSVHTVARKVKRMGLADRWIADFRDEAAVPFPRQKGRLKRYLRDVRENADAVTAASAGYLKVMGFSDIGQVIYNAFDAEDLRGLSFPPKRLDRLTFVHCGQMYGAQRDLSPFFRAVRELIDEGAADREKIALVYAGRDTGGFVSQATAAGLADCLEGRGFLPRDESLKLQKSAHVLLLAAWNDRTRQGNLPGKLLEYLMLAMPVVCCVSGDLPLSEVAAVMRKAHVGFCCEQAGGEEAYRQLKAYVRMQYDRFVGGEPPAYAPDAAAVAAFQSAGMAAAFARLIDGE